MRKEFHLTEEQFQKLVEASKPVPYVFGERPSIVPQMNADKAWAALGDELGFNHYTVHPVLNKNVRYFTAEVKDPVT